MGQRHLSPATDFNCSYEKLRATFTFLNCALQHEKLNRGAWKNLEEYERKIAKEFKVNVRIELEFNANIRNWRIAAFFFCKHIKL